MTIITVSRAATTDEISAEMDRRGAVIEQLETALRQRADEATEACAKIAEDAGPATQDMHSTELSEFADRIAAAIRARVTP